MLAHLDAEVLCRLARACPSVVAMDASLWRRLSLTLFAQPWPPRPPAALGRLRVCSYRWLSASSARRALRWLYHEAGGAGAAGGALRELFCLELVGRNLDSKTLRLCVALWPRVRELSLRDVFVRDEWVSQLASLRHLETLHLDWNTVRTT